VFLTPPPPLGEKRCFSVFFGFFGFLAKMTFFDHFLTFFTVFLVKSPGGTLGFYKLLKKF
jgi:hypothetical protein